ncbi:alternative NAD(P)H-ubiquinone oxidoreductase C1, chloroplastic/mitochondrial-like [Vicia villosa]|uniref:alternative NAD(P)H-ubiquinone oxidoreductase C1, chloroplastic/mitochondrial-like n=1 Tax=Vicia villosa TaxID=3911 RepID=UPI00273C9311|nr:alternative NAD(P)H-ubiquinone oxidoreductase C1, chloroplastic/mitochondrial-like [Vicia villosa]
MSHIALTSSPTVVAFHRGAKQWSTLFPSSWRTRGINPSSFPNSARKRLQLRFFASGGNGGVVDEISETVKAHTNFVWPDNKKPRVCILGGGFGGLYTALRLESLQWPKDKKPHIALVDQSERFVFKPLLYELLSGEVDEWEIAPRFSDLLANTGVQFLKDRVKVLQPSDHLRANGSNASTRGGTVHLESGLHIEYDWLVLALGSEAKLEVVPGAVEFAIPFSTLEDARKVNNRLTILERKTFGKTKDHQISVAIVGCGYSGIELAATVAERLQNRGIVRAINNETTICPTAPPGNREAALKVLSSRKVELLLGYFVNSIRRASELDSTNTPTGVNESIETVPDFEKYILELQPAERGVQRRIVEADLVLWTVGSKPPLPHLEYSDVPFVIPLNARGQAETDETLRVKGHPRIFALGDSSALRDSNGRILPATAQVAFQQADFTGWNLWAAINGRPLLPFRFQNLGEMMTLGRSDAAITPSFIEGLTLEGPVGHTARKIAYLMRLPTDEHRLKVGISWFTKSAVESVSLLQSTLSKVLSDSSARSD